MKPLNCELKNNFTIQDSKNVKNATNRIQKILHANYDKANLKKTNNKLKYLR